MLYVKRTLILMLVLFSAAAVFAQDEITFTTPNGQVVRAQPEATESFDRLSAWESYVSPDGVELGVDRGVYRAYSEVEGFVWGLNDDVHADAIIEVDALLLNIFTENGYGVMCRADEDESGNGYYFMINANGYYAIFLGDEDGLTPLIDWERSDAIHDGIDSNHLQVMCYRDSLALYANGELVAETQDDTYDSGYAGLAVAASHNPVDVAFDNLSIYQVADPSHRSAP